MKSNVQLVDQFIEDVVSGVIESRIGELRKSYSDKDWKEMIAGGLVTFNGLLTEYRKEVVPERKAELASMAVNLILHFRLVGLDVNKSDAELLQITRDRVKELEEQLGDKARQIERLNEDLTKLRVGSGAIR